MGWFGIEFGISFGLELDWAKGLCLGSLGWATIILFFILAVKKKKKKGLGYSPLIAPPLVMHHLNDFDEHGWCTIKKILFICQDDIKLLM